MTLFRRLALSTLFVVASAMPLAAQDWALPASTPNTDVKCTTCADTQAANQRATDLKNRFVLEFNKYSTQYLQRSFDANSL